MALWTATMSYPTSLLHPLRLVLFTVLIALIVASSGASWSSVHAGGEEWRPVDPAHLALRAPSVEPTADAEAIFWDIRIDDGGYNDLVLSHYVRIKIFTERGRDKHSKVDLPYIGGLKIKDVAARTIKPDGSIVELAKDDIIEKMVVKVSGLKLRTKTFAFQGIEPGAIIEYKWKEVISHASADNMSLEFQREIPVQAVTFFDPNVVIPGALRPAGIAVRTGATWKLYDPGVMYLKLGMLRWQEEGVQWLVADQRPEWIKTPMSPPEKSKEKRVANLKLDENGTLEGDVSIEYTGHLSIERKLLNDDDSPVQREENLKEAMKARLSAAELT